MGQHKPSRCDRIFHNREVPSGVRPGDLKYYPHAPSETERPSSGFITIIGASIFGSFVFIDV